MLISLLCTATLFYSYVQSEESENVIIQRNKYKLPSECGPINTEVRIVGGTTASLGAFPWIARVGFKNNETGDVEYFCGGSLITKNVVISAQHCITIDGKLFVKLGENVLDTDIDCDMDECADPPVEIAVKKAFFYDAPPIHYHRKGTKRYFTPNPSEIENDIALLKLERDVEFTDWITPICLSQSNTLNSDHAIVAGWGFSNLFEKEMSNTLEYLTVTIAPEDVCVDYYKNRSDGIVVDPAKHICVAGELDKDSCNGDSGGPLMQIDDEGRYLLIGVVSFGSKSCGMFETPSVYSRVGYYFSWILQNI